LDKSPNVIYIARPCQFTPLEIDHKCDVSYWTDKRFSEEVVSSVNQAISKLVARDGGKINLIGYSGGANVAVLVAARRGDIASIRTIAGNLDHVELHKLNEVSQLRGSLNAIDEAKKVSNIPQIHYSGSDDEIVSPKIAEKFVKASGNPDCVKTEVVNGASHEDGWSEAWSSLLGKEPRCRGIPNKTE
jgi:pimeloyl-ACP methyl ester carboxylesterase